MLSFWRACALTSFLALTGCGFILGLDEYTLQACVDGLRSGDESDIDCGGSCGACALGRRCFAGADCQSLSCVDGTCSPPACDDEAKNGDETDVDCGGSCSAKCGPGLACDAPSDCKGGACDDGACTPTCDDGVTSGEEPDTDCGGPQCDPCAVGSACTAGSDCVSQVCSSGQCKDNHVWSRSLVQQGSLFASAVAADNVGNIALAGQFQGTLKIGETQLASASGEDLFFAKMNPDGEPLFAYKFGSIGDQKATGLAVNSAGDILLNGYFTGDVDFGTGPLNSSGETDIFVAKLLPNGSPVFAKQLGGTGFDYAAPIEARGLGIFVTGYFSNTVNFGGGALVSAGGSDVFILKLNEMGGYVWNKRYGDGGEQFGSSIKTDGSGNVIVAGCFEGSVDFGGMSWMSAGSYDIFLVKLDASGNHQWSRRFGDSTSQYNKLSPPTVAIDGAGNVFLLVTATGTIDFGGGPLQEQGSNDIFLAKFDPDGNHVWSRRFGDNQYQYASAIVADALGNVGIVGGFAGTIDVGSGPVQSSAPGKTDVLFLKLSGAGEPIFFRRFGDEEAQSGRGLTAAGGNSVVLTGDFLGTVSFGGSPLVSSGSSDTFIAKLVVP